MKKIFISLLLTTLIIPIIGCGKKNVTEQNSTKDISFEILEQGSYSGLTEAENYEISSDSGWQAFWKNLKSTQLSAAAAPQIDFSKEMVVAIALGEKSSGGYKIDIEKIIDNGFITVTAKETKPSQDDITTQALTQPYVIAKIPVTNKEVDFIIY